MGPLHRAGVSDALLPTPKHSGVWKKQRGHRNASAHRVKGSRTNEVDGGPGQTGLTQERSVSSAGGGTAESTELAEGSWSLGDTLLRERSRRRGAQIRDADPAFFTDSRGFFRTEPGPVLHDTQNTFIFHSKDSPYTFQRTSWKGSTEWGRSRARLLLGFRTHWPLGSPVSTWHSGRF